MRALGDPGQLTAAVRGAVQAIDIDQPVFNVKTMTELLTDSQWPYRVFGTMFGVFALVALVLSAVGIYAVTAYAVTQRTPEIGVRMALGARASQVSWLILKTGLVQLAIGVTLGLLGAWGVTSVLQSLVVQISPTDPVTFTAVTAILSLVTIARVPRPGAARDAARSCQGVEPNIDGKARQVPSRQRRPLTSTRRRVSHEGPRRPSAPSMPPARRSSPARTRSTLSICRGSASIRSWRCSSAPD